MKRNSMSTQVMDTEFMQYWSKLNLSEKESLLSVAKHYVELKSDETDDLRKQLVMEERAKYLKGEGTSYSWEDVKTMALNKERRNGL